MFSKCYDIKVLTSKVTNFQKKSPPALEHRISNKAKLQQGFKLNTGKCLIYVLQNKQTNNVETGSGRTGLYAPKTKLN